MGRTAENASEEIPALIKVWLILYHAVPKVYLPNTKIDISFMVACGTFLFGVKLFFHRLLETVFQWPTNSEITWDAAASMTGVFHSLNLLPPLWMLLRSQPYNPSGPLHAHPQWWQDASQALLQLTTGYMIYDMIVNIIALRWVAGHGPTLTSTDYLFLGHHLATMIYMTSTRMFQAGHGSAMACMWLGEATNPLFNSYLVTNLAKTVFSTTTATTTTVMQGIEISCALLFVFIRVFLSLLIFLHMTYDLVSSQDARTHIPVAMRILWVAMIWGVVFGSIPWVYDFVDIIKSYYIGTSVKEEL